PVLAVANMDEEAMENLRGGEGAGDEESLARGVTTDSNTIDDTANAVSIHGNQVSQQHGAGSHDGDDQQVRALAAASSGGKELPETANFKDLGADANSDSRETDSVDQRDEGDDFHPLTESSNATAGGNAGSGALQANNASKPTKEESLKATINEELSHFVDLDKIRQPIEKALEIGGLASDFDYLDYLELWGGYNQSDITDLLDFLKRLVTNTNSKSKKMSTIWSNAQKRSMPSK
ncbi:Hypothetical Protein FCC1311_113442, partial [Hondaea fermentalgiana]